MELRTRHIHQLGQGIYDVLIIGGGINGAAAAAALSARGARVALLDRGDFAGFTSQHSSNLIWGGLKYLESYEFALVRKLCLSRNRLLVSYPSRVQEIRFLVTVEKGFRYHPVWLWLGTWLYWILGNGFTQPPRWLSRRQISREAAVVKVTHSSGGVEYSDACLPDNDARFVFDFIRAALDWGCIAANYVESLGARRTGNLWVTRARDVMTGSEFNVQSKLLINAAGPFVDAHNRLTGQRTEHHHIFSKGVHLIVERLHPEQRVLAFFADDGRLFFAIPMGTKTCIGTTDTPVEDPFTAVTAADRRFILDNINKRLNLPKPLTEAAIIAERCGVRPLAIKDRWEGNRDWLQLSRKHIIEVNPQDAHISLFGGKLTDCVHIGDELSAWVRQLGITLPQADYRWYGEPQPAVKAEYLRQAKRMRLNSYTAPFTSELLTDRLWRRYGARACELLEAIRREPRQAEVLITGTEYLRCEIEQAKQWEMIVKLEDFLRRRSNIAQLVRQEELRNTPGLLEACQILFGDQAREKFNEYFQAQEIVALQQKAS
jgi:glycerol-3-phosphate dehydrogenase